MENVNPQNIGYDLGLDIGIASVGWALVTDTRIIDLGVRAFNAAETGKKGDPLNLQRRTCRLARKRLKRRATRLKRLSLVLAEYGLISDRKIKIVSNQSTHPQPRALAAHILVSKKTKQPQINTWQLRKLGLDHKLDDEQWARVIYHICKHRGFYWVSRAEQKELAGLTDNDQPTTTAKAPAKADEEKQKVKQGLKRNREFMQQKNYRTIAEMVLAEHQDAQRNKHGEYTKALPRELLAEELTALFAAQRKLGNIHAGEQFKAEILGNGDKKSGLFWQQQASLSGKALLKMLGKCTFEQEEKRGPKHSFSAEHQVWLTRLNNLRINQHGTSRKLNKEEREAIINLPYRLASDFTYKQLRRALENAGSDLTGAKFAGLRYQHGEKPKDPETAKLASLKGWQTLRKIMADNGLTHEWEQLSGQALLGKAEQLDSIAWVLSVYKEDDEVTKQLNALGLDGKIVDCLLDVRFDKFHSLSLKALRNIIPAMQQGKRYDEACQDAGYHHSMFNQNKTKTKYLPKFYLEVDSKLTLREDLDLPRNPVVLRSLNQARKVVNAIIKRYGSPTKVHIELARDMGKPAKERRQIEREQAGYREMKQQSRDEFMENFHRYPVKDELEKFLMYREQDGKCPYSLNRLDIRQLLDMKYAEIDHILPWSRSYDDSKNNKVLVFTKQNQDKGNRTPYEFFGADEKRWNEFEKNVETNKKFRQAKIQRLTRKDFVGEAAEGFRERNLNDTRYACRFFKNFVQNHLLLHEQSKSINCISVSGQLTAQLRFKWGLEKKRDESDKHHALDAVIVACCSQGMVQKATNYHKYKESRYSNLLDPETGKEIKQTIKEQSHFPQPWDNFRQELQARLYSEDKEQLTTKLEKLSNYTPTAIEAARPLLVSRAPQRRNRGAAHKETIYKIAENKEDKTTSKRVITRVPLGKLALKDIADLVDPHCNQKLYAAIKQRLQEHNGKAKKAFAEPLHKPDKQGNPTGPIVRSVKKYETTSGENVRGGRAANSSMVRVDVFSKDSKYHLVPVYIHQRGKQLPNRAVVAHKDEEKWGKIDDSFAWHFSLYPNDYLNVSLKGKATIRGYFGGLNRNTGAINIWLHDRDKRQFADGYIKTGVKNSLAINKFHVDLLGNLYPAKPETRDELA